MKQMWVTRISTYETEGNGDSVTAHAGPDQHIDVENIPPTCANNPDGEEEEVNGHTSINNSDVEEDPTNGDLAARVKIGSKIGIFAAGTSVAGVVAVVSNSGCRGSLN